jgi:hypothetical protein
MICRCTVAAAATIPACRDPSLYSARGPICMFLCVSTNHGDRQLFTVALGLKCAGMRYIAFSTRAAYYRELVDLAI